MENKRDGINTMGLSVHESSGGSLEEIIEVDKPMQDSRDDKGG
jgi:hypothetical protein